MNSAPSVRPRLALVTCTALPLLYGEEQELLPMLERRGLTAEAVIWNDPSVDWSRFGGVVLRSTWDYFTRFAEFSAWLARVERVTRVWNSPSLVRWNFDKMYLRDLERRGVRILPTVFCEAGRRADLAGILRDKGWERAVLKPSVSGGAYRTHLFDASDAARHQIEMNEILTTTGALVQPFFPEIQSEGEWSFLFFDGELSHVVVKTPSRTDYRVQPEFGGTFTQVQPDPGILAQARSVLTALPEAPAYARIDGVRRGGDFYLMEAELIEPYLYLSAAEGSAARYVSLVDRLARS